jgi:hypothetical protein
MDLRPPTLGCRMCPVSLVASKHIWNAAFLLQLSLDVLSPHSLELDGRASILKFRKEFDLFCCSQFC